ncbi:MAG: sodium/proton-translocating pyrophosphatase, partial [Firmicutes bacterium]|nr:sodium/proton-translocating pyrophosphatase [Bacillota bacterium]
MISHLFWIGLAGALISLGFALFQMRGVLKLPEGDEQTKKIAKAIRTGANAYLKRQYKTVLIIIAPVFLLLFFLAWIPVWATDLSFASAMAGAEGTLLNPIAPFAFLSGAFFTGLSGYIGMRVATWANSRTATAAKDSLNKGLRVSFSSGTVMGFTVVGLSLLDISIWFLILRFGLNLPDYVIGNSMIKFGLGVAFMAMFARVGGGIFTKAADVGADLVGKVEAGIPEDDPRNPAVIADNVGDNVGDVAGMGADLYEAFAHAIIGTFALGASIYSYVGMLLPLLVCVVGVVASIIGSFLVRTKEHADQKSLLKSLHRGTWIAGGITAVAALPITWAMSQIANTGYGYRYSSGALVYTPIGGSGILYQSNWIWGLYACIIIGIAAGLVIAFFSEYFTSDTYKPTKELAESTKTGSATVIIGGLSLGMKSTVGP